MASTPGDRVERLTGALDLQTVPDKCVYRQDEWDDAQLVEDARQGDRDAFGRLYDRYARMVHGILLARVPLRDVDDLVHDVFLLALPRLHSLRDVARFGGWLAAITRNRANDYHRRGMAEVEVELSDEMLEQPSGGPASLNSADAEAASVLAAIRTLP